MNIRPSRNHEDLRIRPGLYILVAQLRTERLWILEGRRYFFGIPWGWKELASHQDLRVVLGLADHLCGVAR